MCASDPPAGDGRPGTKKRKRRKGGREKEEGGGRRERREERRKEGEGERKRKGRREREHFHILHHIYIYIYPHYYYLPRIIFPAHREMATPPEILWMKVKEEPLVFIFLGLTCAALGGGLRTLANGDKRQSQLMMRARVFFQLCTVTTLAGTVYWKAYTGEACALLFSSPQVGRLLSFSNIFFLPWNFFHPLVVRTPPHLVTCPSHPQPSIHLIAVMGQKRSAGQKLPDYLLDSRLMDAVEGAQCALPPAAAADKQVQLK